MQKKRGKGSYLKLFEHIYIYGSFTRTVIERQGGKDTGEDKERQKIKRTRYSAKVSMKPEQFNQRPREKAD